MLVETSSLLSKDQPARFSIHTSQNAHKAKMLAIFGIALMLLGLVSLYCFPGKEGRAFRWLVFPPSGCLFLPSIFNRVKPRN